VPVEDLFVEVWSRLFTSIEKGRITRSAPDGVETASFHTLISRYVLKGYLSIRRKEVLRTHERLEARDGVRDIALSYPSQSPSQEDLLQEAQTKKALADCIKPMGAKYSEVFDLMALGFGQTEIAEELGIFIGTAGKRIFVIRRELRAFYEWNSK
jgi:DNA-directed RNA polymerase specialized sigma24 family protein